MMADFAEIRFENGVVTRGMSGGPMFSTTVISVNSGFEQRNINWDQARGEWQVGNRLVKKSELQNLLAFFRARQGKAQGFRIRDWSDYDDFGSGLLGTGTAVNGTSVYQMIKRYSSLSDVYDRKIKKPVSGTIKVFKNGVQQTEGSSFGNVSIDYTNGLVTFIDKVSGPISGITKATQAVVTASNTFAIGDVVYFDGIAGMTQMNGQAGTVVSSGPTSFTVNINSTGYGTYTASSGKATKRYLAGGEALTWTGEFDVPVRFNTDKFDATLNEVNYAQGVTPTVSEVFYDLGSVPLIEIRV